MLKPWTSPAEDEVRSGTAWGACEGTEFLDLLLGEDPWKRTENRWRFGMMCFGGRFDGKICKRKYEVKT